MISRERCEAAFRAAVKHCDPGLRVRYALLARGAAMHRVDPQWLAGRKRFGIAMGKAALAMARGAGPVELGVAVTNADDGRPLPAGWRTIVSAHPEPDERSGEAADAVIDVVASASSRDVVLALVSGGASALVERPRPGVTLDQLRARVREVAASGAPIDEINRVRKELSAVKGGKLAEMAEAPIVTLVVSDVVGDDPKVIGSGPTVADRAQDHVIVLVPMQIFAHEVAHVLGVRGLIFPERGDVVDVADRLVQIEDAVVAWGEPTLAVPDEHGEGGRAQQLALELARRFRGSTRGAFVAGSDGQDGPAPANRPAPAGAYVDGTTWDAIAAAGIDPARALARRDAGTALDAVGALFVTGPTGVNHADVIVIG